MKKSTFVSMMLAGIVALAMAGCNVTSHTEQAEGVDFSHLKTFSWKVPDGAVRSSRSDNGILDNNIKNAISEELARKGWTENDAAPDVLLDYAIAVEHSVKREQVPVYGYPYPYAPYFYGRRSIYSFWYPSTLMGVRTENVPFTEGELSVNMLDAKTNRLIWQGWASGEINTKHVTTKELKEDVRSIFRKFRFPAS